MTAFFDARRHNSPGGERIADAENIGIFLLASLGASRAFGEPGVISVDELILAAEKAGFAVYNDDDGK